MKIIELTPVLETGNQCGDAATIDSELSDIIKTVENYVNLLLIHIETYIKRGRLRRHPKKSTGVK